MHKRSKRLISEEKTSELYLYVKLLINQVVEKFIYVGLKLEYKLLISINRKQENEPQCLKGHSKINLPTKRYRKKIDAIGPVR